MCGPKFGKLIVNRRGAKIPLSKTPQMVTVQSPLMIVHVFLVFNINCVSLL